VAFVIVIPHLSGECPPTKPKPTAASGALSTAHIIASAFQWPRRPCGYGPGSDVRPFSHRRRSGYPQNRPELGAIRAGRGRMDSPMVKNLPPQLLIFYHYVRGSGVERCTPRVDGVLGKACKVGGSHIGLPRIILVVTATTSEIRPAPGREHLDAVMSKHKGVPRPC